MEMTKATIRSYSLETNRPIIMHGTVKIMSIEVDILVIHDENIEPEDNWFDVRIVDNSIKVQCVKKWIRYVVLPYCVMVETDKTPVQEKIIVGDWLEKEILCKQDNNIITRGERFMLTEEGEYPVELFQSS